MPLRRNVWWNCFPRLTEVSWPIWQEGLSEAPADEPWRLGLAGRIPARRDLHNGPCANHSGCQYDSKTVHAGTAHGQIRSTGASL